jgi:hypothetical protein
LAAASGEDENAITIIEPSNTIQNNAQQQQTTSAPQQASVIKGVAVKVFLTQIQIGNNNPFVYII